MPRNYCSRQAFRVDLLAGNRAPFMESHMSQHLGRRAFPRWAIKIGVPVVLLAGLVVFASSSKPGPEGEATLQGIAVESKGMLAVSVTVSSHEDGKLIGTLRTELVDARDAVIDSKK